MDLVDLCSIARIDGRIFTIVARIFRTKYKRIYAFHEFTFSSNVLRMLGNQMRCVQIYNHACLCCKRYPDEVYQRHRAHHAVLQRLHRYCPNVTAIELMPDIMDFNKFLFLSPFFDQVASQLTELTIDSIYPVPIDKSLISAVLRKVAPTLKLLCIFEISHNSFRALAKIVFPRLQTLKLSWVLQHNVDLLKRFCLNHADRLQHLHLEGSIDIMHAVQEVRTITSLQTLNIHFVYEPIPVARLPVLRKLSALTVMEINLPNEFTRDMVDIFSLDCMLLIKHGLDFTDAKLTDFVDDMLARGRQLLNVKSIEIYGMFDRKIGDNLIVFEKFLQICPNMDVIYVNGKLLDKLHTLLANCWMKLPNRTRLIVACEHNVSQPVLTQFQQHIQLVPLTHTIEIMTKRGIVNYQKCRYAPTKFDVCCRSDKRMHDAAIQRIINDLH